MKRIFFIVLLVSGCATSSGVIPIGIDTYLISRSQKGFDVVGGSVKADVYKEAFAFCNNQNKHFQVVRVSQKDMVPFTSDAQAEIQFMCLDKEDPELTRPNIKRE
ncbi:hypothetical protein A3741_18205, partial [Oleiphilus sp. HI0069]